MRGHVTSERHGDGYAFVVELGRQPCQRCTDENCKRRYRTVREGHEACPRCGGKLADREERRQQWHSGYRTKTEAKRALTDALSHIDKGTYVEATRQSLTAYLRDEWLPATAATLKPTTLRSYKMHVEQHLVPRIGSITLQKLSGATINALYAELLAEGRVDGRGGLSAATVRRVHAMLHKALDDAVRWNKLGAQSGTARGPAQAARPRAQDGLLERGRGERVLAEVAEHRLYALWRTFLATGMRRGEALGLRWSDLDLDDATLSIRLNRVTVGYEVQEATPKSGKGRRIDLDPTTIAALRSHRAAQAEERLAFGPAYDDRSYVFCREDGTPLHPDCVSKMFDALVKRSGLPRIRLHDTRHTHATVLLRSVVFSKVVQERLGHATISITLDTYSHVIPAM